MYDTLLIMNMLAWFVPIALTKGLLRNYLFIIACLFSGSDWIAVLFYSYNEIVPGNVLGNYLSESLYLSILAAVSFYAGFYSLITNEMRSKMNKYLDIDRLENIRWIAGVKLMKITLTILIPLVFLLALQDVGVGDRVYFLDAVNPFWYMVVLPVNSFLLFGWLILDPKTIVVNNIRKDIVLWIYLLAHIFLVGFDGSRRAAILPVIALFIKVGIYNIKRVGKIFEFNLKTILCICILLLITFLTLSRSYDVGWGILNQNFYEISSHIPIFIELIFAPSPTLHVTTQMLDLISVEGVHGPIYYFKAIGNLIFPKFIFGQYFFGEPLVSELHTRFDWYGQDFGFMAEAIYSGGWLGVSIMHFLYGIFIAKVINGYASVRYSAFFKIVSLTILFGLVNSLRSDFMNILKATFYPAIVIYLLLYFLQKINTVKKINNEKREKCAE